MSGGRASRQKGNRLDDYYLPPGEPLESPAPSNGHDVPAQKAPFELIPFDKIKLDTTPAYLVKGIIPRVGLCVFWGPPKCGKSFLVFDLVMHVALGWEYRGRKVRQGSVVYCALEGCSAFKNRMKPSGWRSSPIMPARSLSALWRRQWR